VFSSSRCRVRRAADRSTAQRMGDVRLSRRRVRAMVEAIVALATAGPWTLQEAEEAALDAVSSPAIRNAEHAEADQRRLAALRPESPARRFYAAARPGAA
jgi:hypothetical protein